MQPSSPTPLPPKPVVGSRTSEVSKAPASRVSSQYLVPFGEGAVRRGDVWMEEEGGGYARLSACVAAFLAEELFVGVH